MPLSRHGPRGLLGPRPDQGRTGPVTGQSRCIHLFEFTYWLGAQAQSEKRIEFAWLFTVEYLHFYSLGPVIEEKVHPEPGKVSRFSYIF